MYIFYILILTILLFSPTVSIGRVTSYSFEKKYSLQYLYLVSLTFTALTFVSGFRSSFIDTNTYREMYQETGTNFAYALEQTDKGFFLFMALLNHVTSNSQLLIFVSSIISTFFVLRILYNYSPDFRLSVYLYITTGVFAFSMNGLRQFLAASIIYASIPLILNNRKQMFFLMVLLASTIHSSAFIFIFLYFVLNAKVFSTKVILPMVGASIVLIFSSRLFPLIFTIIGETNFGHYEGDVLSGTGGTSWIRVLVEGIPCAFAFILYKFTKKDTFKTNRLLIILTNLSCFNLVFYILAMQNWIFARVSIYFCIFNLLLIPILLHEFFDSKSSVFLKYMVYIFYFAYFYYQMKYAYGIKNFLLNFNLF